MASRTVDMSPAAVSRRLEELAQLCANRNPSGFASGAMTRVGAVSTRSIAT